MSKKCNVEYTHVAPSTVSFACVLFRSGVHPDFRQLELRRPPPKTPNRCDPDLVFDAVSRMQQEIVFFKDRYTDLHLQYRWIIFSTLYYK